MSNDPASTGAAPETNAPAAPLLAWLPWIAAIGFALLLGFLGQAYFAARSEMTALREQAALADIEVQSLQQQLEAERILWARRMEQHLAGAGSPQEPAQLRVVPLYAGTGAQAPVRAVILWNAARQEGELAAFQLPALPPDQSYRVCITDPQYADPVSAGAFTVPAPAGDARVHLQPGRPVANAARFAISVGSPAGDPRPSDPIVLLSR